MTDILQRLKDPGTVYPEDNTTDFALYEAAAKEIERLRMALQWIHDGAHTGGHTLPDIKEAAGDALRLNDEKPSSE